MGYTCRKIEHLKWLNIRKWAIALIYKPKTHLNVLSFVAPLKIILMHFRLQWSFLPIQPLHFIVFKENVYIPYKMFGVFSCDKPYNGHILKN